MVHGAPSSRSVVSYSIPYTIAVSAGRRRAGLATQRGDSDRRVRSGPRHEAALVRPSRSQGRTIITALHRALGAAHTLIQGSGGTKSVGRDVHGHTGKQIGEAEGLEQTEGQA